MQRVGEEVRLKAGRPDGGSSEFQGPGKGGLAMDGRKGSESEYHAKILLSTYTSSKELGEASVSYFF